MKRKRRVRGVDGLCGQFGLGSNIHRYRPGIWIRTWVLWGDVMGLGGVLTGVVKMEGLEGGCCWWWWLNLVVVGDEEVV